MPANDTAEGEYIQGEQGGTENRPLRDTTDDRVCPGLCTSQGDILSSSRQVGLKPVQDRVRESDGAMEALKQDVVIDSVERCRQIKEDQERWGASISRHQQVVSNPDQSCFSALEARLELLKEVVEF